MRNRLKPMIAASLLAIVMKYQEAIITESDRNIIVTQGGISYQHEQ
jgi:hypothetical protein